MRFWTVKKKKNVPCPLAGERRELARLMGFPSLAISRALHKDLGSGGRMTNFGSDQK
jgi:hypothetical protein